MSDTDLIEEFKSVISEADWNDGLPEAAKTRALEMFIEALGKTPPRQVITQIAQLDELPVTTHVRLNGGLYATKYAPGWQVSGSDRYYDADFIARGDLPIVVLYKPGA